MKVLLGRLAFRVFLLLVDYIVGSAFTACNQITLDFAEKQKIGGTCIHLLKGCLEKT